MMLALVVAGELVFGLAFNVPRFFRPTMLEVFNISNTQLGDMFAVYGIAAMLSYFPGGATADHFSARSLMTVSLVATAVGGLYMLTIPGPMQMALLYGYWGVSTIILFWGALIRATRDWGGTSTQGTAFGILEGGRGLVAASVAAVAVSLLAFYMPDDANLATDEERLAGFRAVVVFYSLLTLLTAAFVWISIAPDERNEGASFRPLAGMGLVIGRPVVWITAAIIICAYCGYKGLDNYSLYAVQVLGMDEVQGARLASFGAWTRPIAAVIAGLIADRFNATRSLLAMFVVLSVSYGVWSTLTPDGAGLSLIYINFFLTYIFVYALRGIYFALLEENRTPLHHTGAAVGLISLIGYTPDIFFAPIGGRILDANPGIVGHQNYLFFLASIAVCGMLTVALLLWLGRNGVAKLWQVTK
ncbi:MAG: MFS transporter [Gammaproteobacteria bacterium]|nr:MFS transporter [Gammaproteobacteria bacterium]